jgi:hypothetical protein
VATLSRTDHKLITESLPENNLNSDDREFVVVSEVQYEEKQKARFANKIVIAIQFPIQ